MDWFNAFVYLVLIPAIVFFFYYSVFKLLRFLLWQY